VLVGGFPVNKNNAIWEAFLKGEIYEVCVFIPFLQTALLMIKVHTSQCDINNLMGGLQFMGRKYWKLFIAL